MRLSILAGAAAMLIVSAAEASAQFTGVVVPPKAKAAPVVDSVPATVAEMRDSVARVNLTNMKDWVDSAAVALTTVPAPVATDTALTGIPAAPPVTARDTAVRAATTTEFREGAPAPNTATPIPLLALLGVASLAAGLWLLRRRNA